MDINWERCSGTVVVDTTKMDNVCARLHKAFFFFMANSLRQCLDMGGLKNRKWERDNNTGSAGGKKTRLSCLIMERTFCPDT